MLSHAFGLFIIVPISHGHPTNNYLEKKSLYGDPRRNITCLGQSNDLHIPFLHNGVDPNTFTMQQLCAKTIYGGAPAFQHFGGWCSKGLTVEDHRASEDGEESDDQFDEPAWDADGSDITGVSFDLSVDSKAAATGDPRFLLGCFNRCFCNYGVRDLTIQPKRDVPSNADNKFEESRYTGEIKLDVLEDVTTYEAHKNGRLGASVVETVRMDEVVEPNRIGGSHAWRTNNLGFEGQPWDLSLDIGNYIQCEGDLPHFPLPAPYPVEEFRSPQELCAVQWSGGLSGSNAGGYCHRSNSHSHSAATEHEVWFSDEMTPRYEYTWGGGNFYLAASIRTYCYAHCWCNSVGKSKTSRKSFTLWQFLRNSELIYHDSGAIDYGRRGPLDHDVYRKLASVLPPQNGPNGPRSGTCGPDGKQFCPAPWPEEQLGPIPRAPPFSTQILAPTSRSGGKRNMTVCGNRCSGPQDCHSPLRSYACDCAFPNAGDAGILGLDPVAPPSVCLSLNRVIFGMYPGLSGRDEKTPEYADENGVPYNCRCNSTYTANECCGSRDGMVWVE